jgi:K+/H+ antiporter YhaU regulatory subunit KhtT
MADQFDNKQLDKRVVHRYLKKGIVDEKEFERLQKSLPDLAEQAMPVEASMEADEADAE